ncbi:bacterial regulatory helix-turn-helix s, AraC family protein [Collimonas fungivorans]|uniref:Bacterial regulatory helix-turn-helix s, AraC family protein n=1 Tax=Collimonas fungivorans TaxID=158899 RepID=A0A127PA63_9BURK|nr:AraC family transcriptional regulator ligand-binding domain-containing protein [Collimonas fungivorans]AMO94555.1 bacterial regulatory helix-turn-helix s, AraC family protein [Collimonas fungivorans]
MQKFPQPDVIKGFAPSGLVRLLFEYLKKQDIDPVALLGIPAPEPFDRGLRRYPMQQWRAMLQLASDRLNDPLLGLRLGGNITATHLGVMGYIFSSCRYLANALIRLKDYHRLVYETSKLHIGVQGSDLTLTWEAEPGYYHGPLVDECAIASFVQFVRNISSKPISPSQVCFINKTPPDIQPYIDFFGCPVLFEQPVNSIRASLWHLATRIHQPDEMLLQMLEQLADAMLLELPQTNNIEQLVRQSIVRLIHDGRPELEQVAHELNMTARTLRRRLDEEGLNYRALLENIRKHLAEHYLSDPRLRLSEIAQLLGYSEQSTFNRAFRRWTGQTPHERQQQLLHGHRKER